MKINFCIRESISKLIGNMTEALGDVHLTICVYVIYALFNNMERFFAVQLINTSTSFNGKDF